MREQAGAIRKTLKMLHRDVEIVVERVDKLNTHFGQARADLEGISTAAERAGKRAARLDNFDFEEIAPEDVTPRVTAPGAGIVPPGVDPISSSVAAKSGRTDERADQGVLPIAD